MKKTPVQIETDYTQLFLKDKHCTPKRTFVISDIHGSYKPFKELLETVKFNFDVDELICIGDVMDGWPEVAECCELLLKIRNLVYVIGNHDQWALDYNVTSKYYAERKIAADNPWDYDYKIGQQRQYLKMNSQQYDSWFRQGGRATINAFTLDGKFAIPPDIMSIFDAAYYYYIDDKNRLFVHGGFELGIDIKSQDKQELIWNRDLFYAADCAAAHDPLSKISTYSEIFIGHTPTLSFGSLVPINKCELWLIDTGASYTGSLTIMDINSHKFWQSAPVREYYPDQIARGHTQF